MRNSIAQPTVLVTARRFDAVARAYLEAQGYRVIAPELNGGDPAHLAAFTQRMQAGDWSYAVGSVDGRIV
jgi:hypothetical protein